MICEPDGGFRRRVPSGKVKNPGASKILAQLGWKRTDFSMTKWPLQKIRRTGLEENRASSDFPRGAFNCAPAGRFSLKSQAPVMGTSFKKRRGIKKINENGATRAAMNLINQHHAKTCMEFWEKCVARLGEDLLRIPGQRFFVFEKRFT